jgi:preprotein translocase subunit Sec61beta
MSRLNNPRFAVLLGIALSLVLAAARFAPALAAPIQWLPH